MPIRPAEPGDRADLYRICLLTGDAGGDASGRYRDPDLLGHLYVGAHLALSPEHAYVAVDGGDTDDGDRIVGYVLGVADVAVWADRAERSWWPALREAHPLDRDRPAADQELVERIHRAGGHRRLAGHPSELHIDLLPEAQGRGLGRRLMERAFDSLRAAGSPGLHVGVDPRNTRAVRFYRHLGFRPVETGHSDDVVLTFDLTG